MPNELNRPSRRDAAYVSEDPSLHTRVPKGDPGGAICIVGVPGSVLSFCSAQLHSTVPNETDGARLSFDFRTGAYRRPRCYAGPENTDSRSAGTSVRGYRCADNLEQLPDNVVAQYDRYGNKEGVLMFDPSVPNV